MITESELFLNRGKPHYKPTSGALVAGWPIQAGPHVQLELKKSKWRTISRPRFHGLISAIAGIERKSPPGPIRSHYRRQRQAAVSFYVAFFGPTPMILQERHLKSGASFYRTPEYQEWAASAHLPALHQELYKLYDGQTNAA